MEAMMTFRIASTCKSYSLSVVLVCWLLAAPAAQAQMGEACGDWTIVPSPTPAGGTTSLFDVDGRSATDVWAIGDDASFLVPALLIHFNGTAWNEVELPDLSGLEPTQWSCLATTPSDGVWVAGFVMNPPTPDDRLPLVMRWDGSDWNDIEAIELLPHSEEPSFPRSAGISDMLVIGDDDVWMVGSGEGFGAGGGGEFGAFTIGTTIHYDGSSWQEVLAPEVANYRHELFGVDGAASDDVWAVGRSKHVHTAWLPLIYHWDGSAWTPVDHPALDLYQAFLSDVVAISSDDVWAVGQRPGGALFMHWNGTSWSLADSPVNQTVWISNVTAIASDDVWAPSAWPGGFYHWDGVAWSFLGSPEIPGATNVYRGRGLLAVGPCDVWSTGSYRNAAGENFTLTERLQSDETQIPGDADGDGVVDVSDLLAVLSAWGPCGGCPEDFDGNDSVDVVDLLTLLANWS